MNNGLLNFASIFPLLWSTCRLMSAKKECFLFVLNLNPIITAVLRLKLWFSMVVGVCPFFTFSKFVSLSRYWQFIYHIIGVQSRAQLLILWSLKRQIMVLTASRLLSRTYCCALGRRGLRTRVETNMIIDCSQTKFLSIIRLSGPFLQFSVVPTFCLFFFSSEHLDFRPQKHDEEVDTGGHLVVEQLF